MPAERELPIGAVIATPTIRLPAVVTLAWTFPNGSDTEGPVTVREAPEALTLIGADRTLGAGCALATFDKMSTIVTTGTAVAAVMTTAGMIVRAGDRFISLSFEGYRSCDECAHPAGHLPGVGSSGWVGDSHSELILVDESGWHAETAYDLFNSPHHGLRPAQENLAIGDIGHQLPQVCSGQ